MSRLWNDGHERVFDERRAVCVDDRRAKRRVPSVVVRGKRGKGEEEEEDIFCRERRLVRGGETKSTRSPSSLENAIDEDEATSKRNQRRFSSRKIVRNVTPSQLFAIVADVNKYHEFLPFVGGYASDESNR